MNNVSMFTRHLKFIGNHSMPAIIEFIEEGKFKLQINDFRRLIAAGKLAKANELKKFIHVFAVTGTFDKWKKVKSLQEYSGYVILYIDDLPKDKSEVAFQKASGLATTYCCYRSLCGKGLRIIVRITSGVENHESSFTKVADYYEDCLQVPIGRLGMDIAKFCSISFDSALYKNLESIPFHVMEELKISSPLMVAENLKPEVEQIVSKTHDLNKTEFGTFARLVSVDLEKEDEQCDLNTRLINTPCIPAELYLKLPELLKRGCLPFQTDREKDMFVTGAITVLSGCLSSVSGTYDQHTVWANLFAFFVAPAASGKGALSSTKELGMIIHREMLMDSQMEMKIYEQELEQYKFTKRSKKKDSSTPEPDPPIKPKFPILFIPANSSSAAVIAHLEQSKGIGIIFETEADTMANSFKQDWGGYSDLLRKAFHHEPVTYSRKTNNEFIEVELPRIAIVLSGTPSQVSGLIKSADDGLFSRFIFYTFRVKPLWRDVSPYGKVNLTDYFKILSEDVKRMVDFLSLYPTTFHLTLEQWQFLNSHFDLWLREVSVFFSEDASSTVKRLALIVFRIAMILSAIRKFENGVIDDEIYCSDCDFHSAFSLAEVYKAHAMLMFAALPKSSEIKLDPKKQMFFDALPTDTAFTRHEAVKIGASIGIRERTIGKYLNNFLGSFLEQPLKYGPYLKRA